MRFNTELNEKDMITRTFYRHIKSFKAEDPAPLVEGACSFACRRTCSFAYKASTHECTCTHRWRHTFSFLYNSKHHE